MAGGYMGKLLWVNLSTGEIKVEQPDESLYRDFIGGYGVGARVLYSRQKAGVDALGPANILGLLTGPLTGTPAISGTRYTAVGKSPLTGAGEMLTPEDISVPGSSSPAMTVCFLPVSRINRSTCY